MTGLHEVRVISTVHPGLEPHTNPSGSWDQVRPTSSPAPAGDPRGLIVVLLPPGSPPPSSPVPHRVSQGRDTSPVQLLGTKRGRSSIGSPMAGEGPPPYRGPKGEGV